MYTRLHIPKPENEQRARRQIRRMADGRQREIKLVGFRYSSLMHKLYF